MNIKGKIKSIGVPREWTSKDDKKMKSYPVVIVVPYIGMDGKEHSDEVLGELVSGNADYIQNLTDAMNAEKNMEFRLGLKVKEWNGRLFQECKVWDVQILMQ